MKVDKPIGGFFELELPHMSKCFHPDALALTNGRACLSWILEKEKPSRVYIPFYTCSALFEPMAKKGVEFIFYNIDETFEPINLPKPDSGELLILINFFGLKNKLAASLDNKFGKRVVIDDTHRFFHNGYKNAYSFTSARKYFGVPDGAYLYGGIKSLRKIPRFKYPSISPNVKRLIGIQDEAFKEYKKYESSLGFDVKRISLLSEMLLNNIDYNAVIAKRILNFKYLHDKLKPINSLLFNPSSMDVPFCYPFLSRKPIDKKLFYNESIFIPTYWPEILNRKIKGFEIEKKITRNLLPLPVDHRYNSADLKKVVNFIYNNHN